MDASHVYVSALALCCFYSHISTRTFRGALTASLDSCVDKECPFSGVTKSGGVWRKVSESDAGSEGFVLSLRQPGVGGIAPGCKVNVGNVV